MRFRAMGGPRDFRIDLPEWEDFQNSKRYSWLFRVTSREQLLESANKVLTIPEKNIERIVEDTFAEVSVVDATLKFF